MRGNIPPLIAQKHHVFTFIWAISPYLQAKKRVQNVRPTLQKTAKIPFFMSVQLAVQLSVQLIFLTFQPVNRFTLQEASKHPFKRCFKQ